MKLLRMMRRLLIYLALFVAAAYFALAVYGAVQLRRAQQLIAIVSLLKLGTPLDQQANAVFAPATCDLEGCQREAAFSNLPFSRRFQVHGIEMPNIIRPRWWWVAAVIELDQNGHAKGKVVYVDDGNYAQYPAMLLVVGDQPRLFDPCFPSQLRHPGYRARREFRSGALYVDVSPRADERFLHRAFDVRLTCLNAISGCKNPGDIAPAAWNDQIEDQRLGALDSGDQNNVRCSVP